VVKVAVRFTRGMRRTYKDAKNETQQTSNNVENKDAKLGASWLYRMAEACGGDQK